MSLIPVTAPETIGPSGTLAAASDTLFVPDRGFLVGYHAAPAAGAPSDAFSSYWQSGQPAQLLHSVTDGNQSDVALALLTNGTIAVAWQDDGPIVGGPQGQDGIVLALFGEDGVTVPIKEVSQAAGSGGDLDPALAALADGGLAVGWSTVVDGPRPGSGEAVHLGPQVRIVEADGEPRTGLLERDPDPAVDVTVRGLAALADGGFLGVAQLATAESGDQIGARGRIFAPDGSAGTPFPLEDQPGLGSFPAAVALTGDRALVSWQAGQADGGVGTVARFHGPDGGPVGAPFRLTDQGGPLDYRFESDIALAPLPDGGFAAAWTAQTDGGAASRDVLLQRYGPDGAPSGPVQPVAGDATPHDDSEPAIAADPSGRLLVTWTRAPESAPDTAEILGRLFTPGGTEGDDRLTGTDQADRIDLLGGDDRYAALRGADSISGGAGSDTLLGALGPDRLAGQAGPDSLLGGLGRDRLLGAAGKDSIQGGAGRDVIFGGPGNDLVQGGDGGDRVRLGPGNDLYTDTRGPDTVFGGPGDDLIIASLGRDVLDGGAGTDELQGLQGRDRLSGGAGNDSLSGGTHADTIHGGAGDDLVEGGPGADRVTLGRGDDRYVDAPQSGPRAGDTVNGGPGDDTIEGLGGADALSGGAGHDRLLGDAGDDTLEGGSRADTLVGSGGNDVVAGGRGNDTARLGAGDDLFTDSAGRAGGAPTGADTVFGGSGDDRFEAGDGDDVFVGGSGADSFVLRPGAGTDRFRDFVPQEDRLLLAPALWQGTLTPEEIAARFLDTQAAVPTLVFEDGTSLELPGLADAEALAPAIEVL